MRSPRSDQKRGARGGVVGEEWRSEQRAFFGGKEQQNVQSMAAASDTGQRHSRSCASWSSAAGQQAVIDRRRLLPLPRTSGPSRPSHAVLRRPNAALIVSSPSVASPFGRALPPLAFSFGGGLFSLLVVAGPPASARAAYRWRGREGRPPRFSSSRAYGVLSSASSFASVSPGLVRIAGLGGSGVCSLARHEDSLFPGADESVWRSPPAFGLGWLRTRMERSTSR